MKFYITFGSQYRHEEHPNYSDAHPDGWFTIHADSEAEARDLAFARFGSHWSFLYPEEDFETHYYPRGELGVLE